MTISAAPQGRHEMDDAYARRFVAEVLPYREQLVARARRLTPSYPDAEDLVQETFLNAYRGFRTFDEGTNARAWLYQILRNTWVNGFRARQRQPREVLCDDIFDDRADRALSAEAEALNGMRDDAIADVFDRLPEAQGLAVFLADIEGFRYRDVASLTGVPVGTVMSRLARGRRRLRNLLAS
jgi:RNA polymerase sigma-70 factor, ECF subfamily